MQIHPLATLFPAMRNEEYSAFKADIEANGQRVPVWVMETEDGLQVIDGAHRMRACLELGRDVKTQTYSGTNALGFVVSMNLHHRHLTDTARAMVVGRLATMERGRPAENTPPGLFKMNEAARLLNVPVRQAVKARAVVRDGVPELAAAVDDQRLTLETATVLATLPRDEQAAALAHGPAAAREVAGLMRRISTPDAGRKPEAVRLAEISTLAQEGHNAEQIATHIGVCPQYVKRFAQSHGVDLITARRIRVDPVAAIEKMVLDLDAIAQSLRIAPLKFESLTPEKAAELGKVLGESLRVFRRVRSNLTLMERGHE